MNNSNYAGTHFLNSKVSSIIAIALLWLYSCRFINRNCTFLILFAICALLMSYRKKQPFHLNWTILFIVLFSAIYYYQYINAWHNQFDLTTAITLCFGAPFMFIAGQATMESLADNSEAEKEKFYYKLVATVAFGMLIWAIISYATGGVVYNYEDGADIRAVPDFWTGNLWQATNFNGYSIFALIISTVMIFFERKTIRKVLYCGAAISSIYLSLITAARTNLIVFVSVIVSMGILIGWDIVRTRYVIRRDTVQRTAIILICLIICLTAIVIHSDNLISILPLDAFFERASHRGLSISRDDRLAFWTNVISQIPNHPFGGITTIESAHNMILDVARVAGIIPALFLIFFFISSLITCFKLFSYSRIASRSLRVLNSILVVILILSFMIEPVMQAKPFVFISFCLICGLQKGFLFTYERGN